MKWKIWLFSLFMICYSPSFAYATGEITQEILLTQGDTTPWWVWSLALMVFCFFIGIISVLSGVGGGILFVPLVSAFFPFHIDFVRGTGLLIALSGALTASPVLLRYRAANLRVGIPAAFFASFSAIVGAIVGLGLSVNVIQILLAILIFGVIFLMLRAKNTLYPVVTKQDWLGHVLGMNGIYLEASTGQSHEWKTHNTWQGMTFFIGIGFIAGMFGLGAGWATVPVLNLLMGLPFKMAVGTSTFILSITDTAAVWIYFHEWCIIPLIAIPAVIGLMLGAFLGVRIMVKTKPAYIRTIVLMMLMLAGGRSLWSGIFG